jgi:catechol 2,3-dioxygenase-like lactoylglutathione lyase family enzyme
MARIDHVAVESRDPDATAEFYERVFGARVVKTEGHPVVAYLGNTGFALHAEGHAPPHTGIRVSEEERAAIKERSRRKASPRRSTTTGSRSVSSSRTLTAG